jgi:hypothetical protein
MQLYALCKVDVERRSVAHGRESRFEIRYDSSSRCAVRCSVSPSGLASHSVPFFSLIVDSMTTTTKIMNNNSMTDDAFLIPTSRVEVQDPEPGEKRRKTGKRLRTPYLQSKMTLIQSHFEQDTFKLQNTFNSTLNRTTNRVLTNLTSCKMTTVTSSCVIGSH